LTLALTEILFYSTYLWIMAEVTCSKQPTSKQTGKVFWKGRYVDPQELFQVVLNQKTQGQSLAFVLDKLTIVRNINVLVMGYLRLMMHRYGILI
jgi:hypothetical protein